VVRKDYEPWGFGPLTHSLRYNQAQPTGAGESKEPTLQRLFPAFPGGWPGIALLLLRAVVGSTLLLQAGFYLRGPDTPVPACLVGCTALAAGTLLLIGLLTPFAGIVATSGMVAIGLSWLPTCTPMLFEARLPVIFGVTMLLAIIVLGPGAFSFDARLFGRREIIIPRVTPSHRITR
jgi:uncharacterized membrane protein YphA (DoxX/SURF4 family)